MVSVASSNSCLFSINAMQMLLSILLLSTMSTFLDSTPTSGTRSPRRSLGDVKRKLASHFRSLRLKSTIMQKLNRSGLQPESAGPTEEEKTSMPPMEIKPPGDARALDLDPNKKRSNIILSEPFDSKKSKVMKFRLEEWHDVNRLASVRLCINLKPKRRRKRKMLKRKFRKQNKKVDFSGDFKDLGDLTEDTFICRNSSKCSKKKHSFERLNKEKISSDRNRNKSLKTSRSRQKRQRIRLIIFALGISGHKKKKIGLKRTKVTKLYTERMKIPVELVKTAANSENKTLVLLIKCNRCKGKVRMETIYRKRKSSGKNGSISIGGTKIKKLNPNRPYLLLDYS